MKRFQIVAFAQDNPGKAESTLDIASIAAVNRDSKDEHILNVLISGRWFPVYPMRNGVDVFIADWEQVKVEIDPG